MSNPFAVPSTILGHEIRDLTIPAVVRAKAERNGDKIYLNHVPDGRKFSYREVHLLSNRLANGLLARGIRRGEHVALFMDNSPELLLLCFALGKIGAVAVPVNTASRGQLLRYFLAQSDAVALLAEDALLAHYRDIRHEFPQLRLVVSLASEGACRHQGAGEEVVDYPSLLDCAPTDPAIEVKFSDPCTILYTSGTTGPSKGVVFTHARTWLWTLTSMEDFGYDHTDTFYVCLPIFHTNGMHGSTLIGFMCDGSVALTRRFSASRFWQEVRESRATTTGLLGSMGSILWGQAPAPDDADNHLRMVKWSTVPEYALQFEARYGTRLIASYGLSDFGVPTVRTLSDPPEKIRSCGRVRRGYELRIVDEDDFDMPAGQPGEIVLRTSIPWEASDEYYKMPEASLRARRNGWFHTGDRGYLDEDGYLWFLDRTKDSIRRRGENISAWEVEKALLSHPAVADAAVYSVRSDMLEDEVAATVVLAPGQSASFEDLIAHCRRNLSYFMVPRFMCMAQDLPRTSTHKVEKYKLRDWAEKNSSMMWDREAPQGAGH